MALLDNINSSIDELEAAIVSDPSCVARLIQVANSALYGASELIMSVRRAILLLGFDALKDLFSHLPVFDSFIRKNASEVETINGVCLHSLAVARLSHRIAQDVRQQRVEPEAAFCAGLLHDIGRVVLLHLFPEDYHPLLARTGDSPEFDLSNTELETFEVTHAEVGRWFAEAWHMPAPIYQTIAFHHHLRVENRLVMIVRLANYIVERERIGLVDGHDRAASPGPLLRGLNLSPELLKQYGRYIRGEVSALQRAICHAA